MDIQLGEKLFEFRSQQEWINRANYIWKSHCVKPHHTVCVDQQGRICLYGMHFMAAERDNAYPIEVFLIRADMLQNRIHPDQRPRLELDKTL